MLKKHNHDSFDLFQQFVLLHSTWIVFHGKFQAEDNELKAKYEKQHVKINPLESYANEKKIHVRYKS